MSYITTDDKAVAKSSIVDTGVSLPITPIDVDDELSDILDLSTDDTSVVVTAIVDTMLSNGIEVG